ncbi:MAG: CBS domain-containing protein [Planctomycetota bacterium]
MKTVADILAGKGRQVLSIPADASLMEAARAMHDQGVGALVILDGERLAGILAERDLVRHLGSDGAVGDRVAAVMHGEVRCVAPGDSIRACMALMTDRRIRHLPVLEHGRLVGIVSIGDVVKSQMQAQDFLIEQLGTYISGSGI